MAIIIATEDEAFAESLKDSAPQGIRASIRYPHRPSDGRMTRAAPFITVTLDFVRDHAITIGEGLLTAWLYDKMKGKSAQIFHRGEHIAPEEPAIRRMVQEEFEFLKSDEHDEDHDA